MCKKTRVVVFFFILHNFLYGKFWTVWLEHLIEYNPPFSEVWCAYRESTTMKMIVGARFEKRIKIYTQMYIFLWCLNIQIFV